MAQIGGNQITFGFLSGRRNLEIDFGDHGAATLAEYANVPASIASALSMDRPVVTLRDLQTDYSVEDLYDLLEVYMVNKHNERVVMEMMKRQAETKR